MNITQIIVAIVPAIISGLISYFSAVKTANNEIEKLNVTHKNEMEKMEKQLDLQREEIEIQKQSGENEIMNELTGDYMGELVRGKSPRELAALLSEFEQLASNNKKGK